MRRGLRRDGESGRSWSTATKPQNLTRLEISPSPRPTTHPPAQFDQLREASATADSTPCRGRDTKVWLARQKVCCSASPSPQRPQRQAASNTVPMQHVSLMPSNRPPEGAPSASPTFIQPLFSPFISSTRRRQQSWFPSNHPSLALHLLLLPSRLQPGVNCVFFSAAENALLRRSAPAPPTVIASGVAAPAEKRRRQSIKNPVPLYIITAGLSVIASSHPDCRYPCAPWVSREFYFFKSLLGPMAAHSCAPRLFSLLLRHRVSCAAVASSLAIAARLHRAEYLAASSTRSSATQ